MTPRSAPRSAPADDPGPRKARRADAERNRERILQAADAVFTARGTSASTEEVARGAGVGIGTVFRHFPTKEALLEAVFVGRLRRFAAEARSLAEHDDPGQALREVFTRIVDQAATKRALADALAAAGIDVEHAASEAGADVRGALDVLLTRAQQAGTVRRDVDVVDLITLLVGTSRAAEHAAERSGGGEGRRARVVAVVLDGLRAPPATG